MRIRLAGLDEIPEGGRIVREHGGVAVLLAKVGPVVYAMNDICTHEGAPLHDGTFDQAECLLTCPWHAARFDVRTGRVRQDTRWATDAETYPVTVENGEVFVDL